MDSKLTLEEQKILTDKIKAGGWDSIEALIRQLPNNLDIKSSNYSKVLNQLMKKDEDFLQNLRECEKPENTSDNLSDYIENQKRSTNEMENSDILKFISHKLTDTNILEDFDDFETEKQRNQDTVDGFPSCIPAALSPVINI